MKRAISTLLALFAFCGLTFADEGMWLLPLLKQMNAANMAELGCRLTPEQIYSINNSSLKDAIVHFGGGCTGEIISANGLLVTNHHCGYGSIQKLSTPEHNYLEDGYWAMTQAQELPAEGLTVSFLEEMTDVTDIILAAEKKAAKKNKGTEDAENQIQKTVAQAAEALIQEAKKAHPGCEVLIQDFYNDNVYYLIVYKTYTDIRFVGAPPASVGKFGGETDNWMWPRHTGDFSMFRVYADKNNEPAPYSADNVPYTPKQFLKVSLKGIQDGDFAMIMGYPGRTQRFQTASQLQSMLDLNDIRIAARTERQKVMMQGMEADPKVRLQYANKYASSSNGWKKWQGEKLSFEKLDIIGRELQKETAFTQWTEKKKARKTQYGTALKTIEDAVESSKQAQEDITYLTETVYRIGPVGNAATFFRAYQGSLRSGDTTSALSNAYASTKALFKDYNEPLERKIAVRMLSFFRDNANEGAFLKGLEEDFETMDIPAYVEHLFDNSIFASEEAFDKAWTDNTGIDIISVDPAVTLQRAIVSEVMARYPKIDQEGLAKGSKAFGAGLMEWTKGSPSYPDANSTMRLTYGNVKSYSPKDGVLYRHFTTISGVMEKEDPDNYEFIVPAKLKELYNNKDFGQYANEDGKVVTCFLTNNDITGGNSGSPVLNADGELIGLAFDGNWESMSSDVMFEPDLQRCICVDIRYVLFLLDKLGGAGYLLNEMDIVK